MPPPVKYRYLYLVKYGISFVGNPGVDNRVPGSHKTPVMIKEQT